MPKSYLSSQPAAARAKRNNFHPFRQVKNRLRALYDSGHPVSKLEIIVMGGTWSFLPYAYQNWYVREVFRAANEASGQLQEISGKGVRGLQLLQNTNETAENRIIGLTLETRPDFINERELARMRSYGCTRVEIGVQTLDDSVSKLTKRGHGRAEVIRATALLKNYGFKVCYHLMPGLPGSTPTRDLAWFREVFEHPDFCPDFIKIYPCVVLDTAELKKWWDAGNYKPYDDATLIKWLIKAQTIVPEWCRIMRLMRDIPADCIRDGAKFSNLRQIIHEQPNKLKSIVGAKFFSAEKLDQRPILFRDIRAREVGFASFNERKKLLQTAPILVRRNYRASGGDEVFLSFENPEKTALFALLRLRKPSTDFSPQHFASVLKHSAIIREVHSYGQEVSVGNEADIGQHRGFGKRLIAEAERVTREEWGFKKIAIIAGVGTREYYRKFGYELRGTYMMKKMN